MITRARRLLLWALGFAFSLSAAFASTAAAPELILPEPSGSYLIGTRTAVLKDSPRNRELLVTIWYPAKAGAGASAPYMDARTGAEFAARWKLTPEFERAVKTHSQRNAAIAQGRAFPVVLLEHGSGVVPAIYTILAEGLASSGYVVVAANHTPDSLISVFPDGHEVKESPYWPTDADRRTQGVAIGRFAETVLLADVRFVLDQLAEMETRDRFWQGHLDLSRIGIVGHSMGGTTAAIATREVSQIVAGVNLDGSTWPGMNDDVRPVSVYKPFLFLMTEEHAQDPGTLGREYVGKESNTYYVALVETDHMSFTDANLLESRFPSGAKPADTAFEGALVNAILTRSLVVEFLGKYLKNERAPHLDGNARVEKK